MNIQKLFRKVRKTVTIRPTYDNEHWDCLMWGCPDCGNNPFKFYSGPEGGMCTNICCVNPFCRSAFNTVFGLGDSLFTRIPNHWFRNAFPECPEESESYLKFEILQKLQKSDEPLLDTKNL